MHIKAIIISIYISKWKSNVYLGWLYFVNILFNNYIGHWVKNGELKQAWLSLQVVNELYTGEFIANKIKKLWKEQINVLMTLPVYDK